MLASPRGTEGDVSRDKPGTFGNLGDGSVGFVASHRGGTAALDRWCVGALVRLLAGVPVRFVLWDGTAQQASACRPVADMCIGDRPTLLRLVWHPDLYFGEAYTDGRLRIEGDLLTLLTEMARVLARKQRTYRRVHRRNGAALGRAMRNAQHHYDLGNEFYQQWLDREMVYTCAYYESAAMSLEEAQRAKLEYVARKLALRPASTKPAAGGGRWRCTSLARMVFTCGRGTCRASSSRGRSSGRDARGSRIAWSSSRVTTG
jgi:hypothetical protein